MKKKLIFSDNTDAPIMVWQTGKDKFQVNYGLQEKKSLTYGQACEQLGRCLFHALSCKGVIDNG